MTLSGRVGMLHSIRMFKRRLLRRSEGPRHLRQRYAAIHGGTLNINDAKTFTQKLYRRMIELHRTDNPRFTDLADKYRARDVVAGLVGSEYLIPLIWHGVDAAAIPFDSLPAKSIAMVNHASGRNIVLLKPIDRQAVIATLRQWLSEN